MHSSLWLVEHHTHHTRAACLLQGQYTGRSDGLSSNPAPTYGAAGQTSLQVRTLPRMCA